ncbi:MAG: hypothetical protein HKN05_00240 [Rhizobiales bacterium]|nr:hypothetical protein [Hyphomicrobiales bacterium]
MNRMGHDMGYRRNRTVGWTDIAALFAGLAIVALSFIPWLIPHSLLSFIGGDKTGHFAGYAVVGVLALYRRRRLASALLTAGVILYLGGVIELLQGQFNRTTDLADFVANGLGLALAGIIVSSLRGVRRARRRSSVHFRSSTVS